MKIDKFIYFFSLAIAVFIVSCDSDFLDKQPDDMLTLDQVFKTRRYTEQYLANVYSYIPDEANGDRVNLTPASDEAKFSEQGVPGFQINIGNWGPTSSVPYGCWNSMYRGIRSASVFINRVDECEEITPDLRTRYKSEARFLRAYFYFLLLRQYGPLVLLPEVIPVDAEPAEIMLPRSTYDDCVRYIANELDEALQGLPDRVTDLNQLGRPDQLTALALKSRLLLYAASDMFNGNTEYAAFKNGDGTQLINQAYDVNKWQLAAEAAKAVIDRMPDGLLIKYDSEGELDPVNSYRDIYLDKWNKEVIWAYSAGKEGWEAQTWEYNGMLVQVNGYANYGVTQQQVDAFFMENGHRPILGYQADGEPIINPESGYIESGVHRDATEYTPAGVWNMYVGRDPRFYATVTFNGSEWLWHGTDGKSNYYAEFFATGKDGIQGGARGQNPTWTGYVIRKYSGPNSNRVNFTYLSSPSWILFRLGEMYLNYVEALNEYAPGHPDILKYLNLIRYRAGIPGYGEGTLAIPGSQEEMRALIRAERRVELVFESHRVFDTRRWKIAPETDGGAIYGMDRNAGTSLADPTFYKRTVVENRVFEFKHYLWPIEQDELDRNRLLVQNPGW
ncbi:hypothetical protein GCM10011386_26070 [Parapedobacter defluvii]|uniref:RagB/SusD family nutrient uptake outer membrane protein n=1 Tax=Parapedobacter defluvii TaxID=2045106 RepID=A0ABQ1M2S5_9SPHI|nr:RagB/SusD family nutrient uptake outer membrane protein [Parapedobacter defluvii]GGC32729.1 hypothetical protein GCM10011386_26070 [Parapedobacter defluvii]